MYSYLKNFLAFSLVFCIIQQYRFPDRLSNRSDNLESAVLY